MDWELLANVTEIVASLSLIAVVIQLIRDKRTQNLEAFFYLHGYLAQDELSVARKKVRTELNYKDYADWTDEDRAFANKVCASYDQTGMLMEMKVIDKKTGEAFLHSSWGQSIVDQYEALLPFLGEKQTPILTGKEFFKHFTILYEKAKKYNKSGVVYG
jgi:hypothetical protein